MNAISTLTQIHLLLVRAETLAAEDHPAIFDRLAKVVREVEQARDAARSKPRLSEPLIATPAHDGVDFANHMVEVADTLTILGASLGADLSALMRELGDQIRDRAKAELRLN
ncbi:MAG: hypothetical protein KJS97_08955 [Alphaproteobacteria bacterium]|nr:hypothetical protein [Alphaproteobacteria bacterium]